MTKQPLKAVTWLACLISLGVFSNANALSVTAEPATDTAVVGEFIDVELLFDFDELTVGGGVDITVSSSGALAFVDFTPSADLQALDPAFTSFGTDFADGEYYVAPGDFAGFSSTVGGGGDGVKTLGVITVQAVAEGLGIIELSVNNTFGDFFQAESPFGAQTVDLAAGQIGVIPVPAAVWLFGSALALLAGVRRRIG